MRAVGIVRVSQVGGREGESFVSPVEQRKRIEIACERDGLELIRVYEELDVSGGASLEGRVGLGPAVAAIESGEAGVIVAAYFDRFFRSLRVQDEVVSRVEAAGGKVLAVDVGAVSHASAGQWLSSTMLGAVAEYTRRTIRERAGEAQAAAVARGVLPWADVPRGYVRKADKTLEIDPQAAPVIREAFELRANGARILDVRDHLRTNRVDCTYSNVQRMLASPVYVGEIHFGKLVNRHAFEPIVSRELWQAVQRVRVPRGRQVASDRLLARLGILVCSGCGGRMGVSRSGDGKGGAVAVYACPNRHPGECPQSMVIRAAIAEEVVTERVRAELSDITGRASAQRDAEDAAIVVEQAQANLDAAIRAFTGVADEPVAAERLAELRSARDVANERAEHLRSLRTDLTVVVGADWDLLSHDEQRGFIRAVVARAVVMPGKGAGRIRVELRSQ